MTIISYISHHLLHITSSLAYHIISYISHHTYHRYLVAAWMTNVSSYVPYVSSYVPHVSSYVPYVSSYVPQVSGGSMDDNHTHICHIIIHTYVTSSYTHVTSSYTYVTSSYGPQVSGGSMDDNHIECALWAELCFLQLVSSSPGGGPRRGPKRAKFSQKSHP